MVNYTSNELNNELNNEPKNKSEKCITNCMTVRVTLKTWNMKHGTGKRQRKGYEVGRICRQK